MKRFATTLFLGLLFVAGATEAWAQPVFDQPDFTGLFGTTVDRSEHSATDLAGFQPLADRMGDNQTWDFTGFPWALVGTGTSAYISPTAGEPGASDPRAAGATYANYIDLNMASGSVNRRQTWTYHGLSSSELTNHGAYVLADGIEEVSFYDNPVLGMPLPATAGDMWGPVIGTRKTVVTGVGEVDTKETYTYTLNGWGTLITPDGMAPCLRLDTRIDIEVFGFVTTNYAISFLTKDGLTASLGLDANRMVQSAAYTTEDRGTTGGGTAPATAPTLTTPIDGATSQPTTLGLTWDAVADATAYRVDVATDAGFANIVETQTVTGTSATVGPLAEGMTYFWRARGENTNGAGPWATAFSFATASALTAPGAVTLAAPADGAANQPTTLDLMWNAAATADDYTVEVAADAGFATIVETQTVTGTSATVGPLAEGATYFWRVRAANAAGAGPDSATRSFGTSVSAPGAVTLTAPADGATDLTTTPTLMWDAAATADTYTVDVATDAGFANIIETQTLAGTSATVGPLNDGTTYFWRVRAANTGGTGPDSATASFTTASGVAVERLDVGLPANFALHGNYPNPFNPSTVLRFDLPQASHALLAVYDALGREVARLTDGPLTAGRYAFAFEASGLPGGVYLYRLVTPGFQATGTMVLIK